jgi:hypothetical protein
MSAGTPTTLIEISRGFPQSGQAINRIDFIQNHRTTGKIIVLYILIFMFLASR